jgi:hypothetical protein
VALQAQGARGQHPSAKPHAAAAALTTSAAARDAALALRSAAALHSSRQVVPGEVLAAAYQQGVNDQQLKLQQQQQQQLLKRSTAAGDDAWDVERAAAAAAALHPGVSQRTRQCSLLLDLLRAALDYLGLLNSSSSSSSSGNTGHNNLTVHGHWIDVAVQVPLPAPNSGGAAAAGASAAAATSAAASVQAVSNGGGLPCVVLALLLLGPADLSAGPLPAGGWAVHDSGSGSGPSAKAISTEGLLPAAALTQLAEQLAVSAGAHVRGARSGSSAGHPARRLLAHASGSARRNVALLRSDVPQSALVPFHELLLAHAEDAHGGDVSAAAAETAAAAAADNAGRQRFRPGPATLAYVADLVATHCPWWDGSAALAAAAERCC